MHSKLNRARAAALHAAEWTVSLALALLLAACGGGNDAPPQAPAPTQASATIGPAGGTVNGPDGVQLVVPPDALTSDVTIRIARSSAGAPALPAEVTFTPAIYEITPHDLRFKLPVQVRVPLTAPLGQGPVAMAAEAGGTWATVPATYADGFATIERVSLSWFWSSSSYSLVCVNAQASADPYPCTLASLVASGITTTPPGGILITDQGRTRTVTQAGTVDIQLEFSAARDCPYGHLTVRRTEIPQARAAQPTQTVLDRQRIDLTPFADSSSSTGSYLFQTPITAASNGVVQLQFYFQCTRAYRLLDQGAAGFAALLVQILPPAAAPTITQQPLGVSVPAGTEASFSVLASATNPPNFSWERSNDNGANWQSLGAGTSITGGSRYTLTAALADSGAQFRARICNGTGAQQTCIRSNPALLTVSAVSVAPVFVTQPLDIAVTTGQTASFSAVASGTPAPALRWQVADANSSAFGEVGGEPGCPPTPAPGSGPQTTSTCTITQTALANSGRRYRAVATNAAAPTGVVSSAATLSISAAPAAPSITQHPRDQTTTVGGSAAFSVVANGTATLSYAWRLNGADLPSAKGSFRLGACTADVDYSNGNATVTLSNVSAGCSGVTLTVVVSNGIPPSATSNGAVLTVNPVALGLSLLAGNIGGPGMVDGNATDARVGISPVNGIAFDATTGNAYFSETGSQRIRKVTPAGVVSTFAGANTPLLSPGGVAVDGAGSVYVTESGGGANRVLRIAADGTVSVWADRTRGVTQPMGALAIDASGNLYAAELFYGGNRRIFKISPSQVVTTFYDFGDAFTGAGALAVDAVGNVYVAGQGGLYGTVARISAAGALSSVAGAPGEEGNVDATGAAARFRGINGLVIGAGGDLFATDGNNRTIRRITPAGVVTTVSGANAPPQVADGAGTAARYDFPGAIGLSPAGDLLIGDVATLRRLAPDFFASTFVGKVLRRGSSDGTGSAALFDIPEGVALDIAGNAYVGAFGIAAGIRKVTPTGVVMTLAGPRVRWLARDNNGDLVAASSNAVWRVTLAGAATLLAGNPLESDYVDATGADARFGLIRGLAVDASGNVFVSEGFNQNSTIRRITPTGVVTTWAGVRGDFGAGDGSDDGNRLNARFRSPGGLVVDGSSNLYVADVSNFTIRRITPAGDVATVAGTAQSPGHADGTGAAARFRSLGPLALDLNGNLLIGDDGTLRRMTPAGAVSTVLGLPRQRGVKLGDTPQVNTIGGMAVRPNGRIVLTSEAAVLEAAIP